jgi:hypothetical protein
MNCENSQTSKSLDIYFLKSYNTNPQSDVIISGSEVLSDEKAIGYDEIIKYDPENHCFTLKRNTVVRLNDDPPIHKKAFAVVIDGEIIYTGYFWALYSSAICDWINIDYLDNGQNKVYVKLGYPTNAYGNGSKDERNNDKIIKLLECDGKLSD